MEYQTHCGSFAKNMEPCTPLEINAGTDSDSEIGDTDESCFADFKTGFGAFHYTLPKGQR